jgi:hypothetical protein
MGLYLSPSPLFPVTVYLNPVATSVNVTAFVAPDQSAAQGVNCVFDAADELSVGVSSELSLIVHV